jgi:glycosyltransferase involved in cell wall biosynthesis
MRLAVVHNLPTGGALRAADELLRRLERRHDVVLHTLSTAESALDGQNAPAAPRRVHAFAPSPRLARPFGMFDPLVRWQDVGRLDRAWRAVARELDAWKADVVLVHPCRHTQAPLVLNHLTAPSVYFCQEPPRALYEPGKESEAGGWVERLRALRHRPLAAALARKLKAADRDACRSAGAVAVNSRFSAGVVRGIYGVEPEVVYLGVDGERFAPGEPARGDHVVSVGALSPLKGFDLVVDALALVPAAGRPRLVIASDRADGAYADALRERARAAGVQLAIEMRVSDARLAELYRSALCTVYAPVREPFGLVPLESMACGTPVVGVREGGVAESVEDGETGALAERSAPALAHAIAELIGDRARLESLGARGRARVLERWTWDAASVRLEALLERAAARGRA